ncbi:hypothetical protein R6Q59_034791 [Mikania micrantha]
MTHFKICICLIIIVIIAGLETLVTEGRQIKHDSPENGVPSARRLVADEKVVFPPQIPDQSQGYAMSEAKLVTDYRPTTPGNSPGVGHSFTEHRFETQAGSSPATGPGHSPGGGHSKQDQVTEPHA